MKKFLPIFLILFGLILAEFFLYKQEKSQPSVAEEKISRQQIFETFAQEKNQKTSGIFATPEALNGELGKLLLSGYQAGLFSEVDNFDKERIYSRFTVATLELKNNEEKITLAVARDSEEQQDVLFFAVKTAIDTKIETIDFPNYQYKILFGLVSNNQETSKEDEWFYFSDIRDKETEFFMKTSKQALKLSIQTTENGSSDLIVRGTYTQPFMDFTFYNQNNEEIYHIRDLYQPTFPVKIDYQTSDILSYNTSKKIHLIIDFKDGRGEFTYDLETEKITKIK